MATPVLLTGFEYGVLNINGGGLVTAITGSGMSIQSTTKRTGGYALKGLGSGGETLVSIALPLTTQATFALSFYFMWHTLPNVEMSIARVYNAAGSTARINFDPADQKIFGRWVTNGAKVNQVLAQDTWYRIEAKGDCSTGTSSLTYNVEAVGEQVTTYSQTATTFNGLLFGFIESTPTINTGECYWDDAVFSFTLGDYPLGPHAIVGLSPNSGGTSVPNPPTNIEDNASVTVNDSSNPANVELSDVPFGSLTTYIKQVGAQTGYAAVGFADTAETNILGVQAYVAYHSAGTSSNNASTRMYDGTTVTVVYTGDMSESSQFYKTKNLPIPSGGWTTALVNGLEGRVGYATDYNPVPYWDALLLEVAYIPVTGYTLQTTTGSFTWTRNNSIDLYNRITLTTAGSYIWTRNSVIELYNRKTLTTAGSYTWTRNNVIELFSRKTFTTLGSFTWTRNNAIELYNRKTLTTAGSYVWTRNNAILAKGFPLKTTTGVFTLDGKNAIELYKRLVLAAAGSYIWTRNDAILTKTGINNYYLWTTAGAFIWTRNNAIELLNRKTLTTAGVFTWNRNNAIELVNRKMFTTAGSYTWTRNNAIELLNRKVLTTAGGFTLDGKNAIELWKHLTKTTTGQFTWTGLDAILTWLILGQYKLQTTTGVFTLSGKNGNLLLNRLTKGATGSFSLSSAGERLLYNRKTLTTPGSFALVGNDAILNWIRFLKLLTNTGQFDFDFIDAILTIGSALEIYGNLASRDRNYMVAEISDLLTMTVTGNDNGE